MNYNKHLASPRYLFKSLTDNYQLIQQIAKREVIGRYKGSLLGLLWSFFNPVLMLGVYTFVFSVVFKARWGTSGDVGKGEFAYILFAGLIIHSFFAECISRAPILITSNTNYVKKVVFPIQTLVWSMALAALFHAALNVLVLLVFYFLLNLSIHWTAIFFPFVMAPLVILSMGLSWFLASLGVYVRDIVHLVGLITTILLFLSPIFYPASALPEAYRPLIMLNPLTFIIEQSREVLIWGHAPNWSGLGIYTLVAALIAWLGFAWFQKTRSGFADVL